MGPYIYKDMVGFVPSTLEPRVSGIDLSRIFGRSPAMFHILDGPQGLFGSTFLVGVQFPMPTMGLPRGPKRVLQR